MFQYEDCVALKRRKRLKWFNRRHGNRSPRQRQTTGGRQQRHNPSPWILPLQSTLLICAVCTVTQIWSMPIGQTHIRRHQLTPWETLRISFFNNHTKQRLRWVYVRVRWNVRIRHHPILFHCGPISSNITSYHFFLHILLLFQDITFYWLRKLSVIYPSAARPLFILQASIPTDNALVTRVTEDCSYRFMIRWYVLLQDETDEEDDDDGVGSQGHIRSRWLHPLGQLPIRLIRPERFLVLVNAPL